MDDVLAELSRTIDARRGADPAGSYVAGLHHMGIEAILKKVGEEAAETIIAALSGNQARTVHETADLWFHTLVMLSHLGIDTQAVLDELQRRSGRSGLEEKANRGAAG